MLSWSSDLEMLGRLQRVERFAPHAAQVPLEVGHREQRQQREGDQVEERRLSGFEHLRTDRGCQQSKEVTQQRTVEIGEARAEVSRGRNTRICTIRSHLQ